VLDQEQKLVEEAKQDPEKFAALYDRYFDQIYRYIYRRVSDKETVQDLVSQTFYDAFAHLKSFEWRGFSFAAWLYKIAHNNVLKWYREQSKARIVEIEEGMQIPDVREDVVREVLRSEDQSEVQAVMAKLDHEDREIIRLKFFEELSNIEIAEVMGLSANHIGVKVFRALKKFKQLFS